MQMGATHTRIPSSIAAKLNSAGEDKLAVSTSAQPHPLLVTAAALTLILLKLYIFGCVNDIIYYDVITIFKGTNPIEE